MAPISDLRTTAAPSGDTSPPSPPAGEGESEGGAPIRLRQSRRARRISIRISPGEGIVVTTPPGLSRGALHRLLAEKREWIRRTLAAVAGCVPVLANGIVLEVLGNPLTIELSVNPSVPASAALRGARIVVSSTSPGQEEVRGVVRALLMAVGRRAIPQRVAVLAAANGFRYAGIQVRNQKTRWGSCSRTGMLSFNWRLVLLPPAVMDYLIVHELCHLRVMNHSPRFWSAVQLVDPAWKESERWLRRHGRSVAW